MLTDPRQDTLGVDNVIGEPCQPVVGTDAQPAPAGEMMKQWQRFAVLRPGSKMPAVKVNKDRAPLWRDRRR